MADINPSQTGIKSKINNSTKQETTQIKRKPKVNAVFLLTILIICISASLSIQRLIWKNWESASDFIFGFHAFNAQSDKFTILKQSMLYIAGFQLLIAMVIMHIRIFGQYINPVGQKDPLSINLLNRILSNNIEQSIVFFGLYAYLIVQCPERVQDRHVFCLPLIFLIGRAIFATAYIFATIFRIMPLRSLGFSFIIGANVYMLQLIFNSGNMYSNYLFG